MKDETSEAPLFKDAGQEAVFWRGAFIHRYSAVEWSVTELLHRALVIEDYATLGKLPRAWPEKLQRLKRLLLMPGPLSPFAERAIKMLRAFSTIERHRHSIVHGMMGQPRPADPEALIFMGFEWIAGDLGETTLEITVPELKDMTQSMRPLVTDFVALCREIVDTVGLTPIRTEPRVSLEPIDRGL